MQKRKSEENPDDGTQDGKQCIQHTRGGFGGFAGPIPDITPEKEEESGYDAARHIIGKTKCDGIQNQMRLFGGRVSPKRKATKISHTHTKKHRSNGF